MIKCKLCQYLYSLRQLRGLQKWDIKILNTSLHQTSLGYQRYLKIRRTSWDWAGPDSIQDEISKDFYWIEIIGGRASKHWPITTQKQINLEHRQSHISGDRHAAFKITSFVCALQFQKYVQKIILVGVEVGWGYFPQPKCNYSPTSHGNDIR